MRKGLGRHNYRSAGGPQPSLVLDFAGTGTLDPRVTFTRSTTGTYYNSSGVLSTASINAPRFDYNPSTLAPLGLLIEQSSTNLILYSGAIGGTGWALSGATATLNAAIGPDGNTVMTKLAETATTTNHRVSFSTTVTTTTYAYSVFAKAAERNNIMMLMVAGAGYILQNFNLLTGTVQSSGSFGSTITAGTPIITSIGNGIYRCTMIATVVTGVTVTYGCDVAQDNTVSTNYAGTAGSGIYIWGAQLEALAFPTSYIPTTSAQVTRAADVATMTGTNFSSWYNASEGTIFSNFSLLSAPLGTGNKGVYCFFLDGNNVILSYGANSGGLLYDQVIAAGVVGFNNGSASALLANTQYKDAMAYATNNTARSINASTPTTDTSCNIPSGITTFRIGQDDSSNKLNGWLKNITYYPQRLANTQLQALTT